MHRRVAGFAEVLHLVTAVARPGAYVGGGADHFGGALIVHHLEGRCRAQGILIDEGPPHARFPGAEEIFHEILFHVQVLVEQLCQQFLVVPVAQTHHGEFEETRHGRRKDEEPFLFKLHVQQHSPRSEVFEDL